MAAATRPPPPAASRGETSPLPPPRARGKPLARKFRVQEPTDLDKPGLAGREGESLPNSLPSHPADQAERGETLTPAETTAGGRFFGVVFEE